jgi:hypothetical protein
MISASRPARAFHCPRKWRNDNYWRAGQATRIHLAAPSTACRSGSFKKAGRPALFRSNCDPTPVECSGMEFGGRWPGDDLITDVAAELSRHNSNPDRNTQASHRAIRRVCRQLQGTRRQILGGIRRGACRREGTLDQSAIVVTCSARCCKSADQRPLASIGGSRGRLLRC